MKELLKKEITSSELNEFEDSRGNTCCVKCGDKIEGGYCSCYNKK